MQTVPLDEQKFRSFFKNLLFFLYNSDKKPSFDVENVNTVNQSFGSEP